MTFRRIAGRVSLPYLIVIAAFAGALGLWLGARLIGGTAQPTLAAAILDPAPRALPDFHLTRSTGAALTLADWKGRWTVAFFGYTNCPDICPTTLATFKQVWTRLDPATKAKLGFDFVSVDPQRDTADVLGKYVAYFSPDFVAASGDDAQLAILTGALGLVYSRGEPTSGTYAVDHSASAVIVDPDGRLVGLFRPPFDATRIASDLAALVHAG